MRPTPLTLLARSVLLLATLTLCAPGCRGDADADADADADLDWSDCEGCAPDATPGEARISLSFTSLVQGRPLEEQSLGRTLAVLEPGDLYRFAEHTVVVEAQPERGDAIASVALLLDGQEVWREAVDAPEVDRTHTFLAPLEALGPGVGPYALRLVMTQTSGAVVEQTQELAALLNVTRLAQRRDGLVWFGTFDAGVGVMDLGADLHDPSDDRVQAMWSLPWDLDTVGETQQPAIAPNGEVVTALALDADEGLWIGTLLGGVTYLDDGGTPLDPADDRFAHFAPSEHVEAGLLVEAAVAFAPDGDGVWIATLGGLLHLDHAGTPLDPADDTWTRLESEGRYDPNLSNLVMDARGRLWLTAFDLEEDPNDRNALIVLDPMGTPGDPSDDRWGRFNDLASDMSNRVYALSIDAQDLKWIGTSRGLFVLDDNGSPFEPSDDRWAARDASTGLAHDAVSAVHHRADGSVWIGAFDPCGGAIGRLALLDPAGAALSPSTPSPCPGELAERRLCGVLNPGEDRFVVDYTTDDGLAGRDAATLTTLPGGQVLVGAFSLFSVPAFADYVGSATSCPDPDPDSYDNERLLSLSRSGLTLIDLGADPASRHDDHLEGGGE